MKNKPICFVIMGYGKKTDPDTGKTLDLDKTYINVIQPAVLESGYECIRGDEIQESGIIDKSMYAMLIHADLVIADISTYNPNAIYELGIRHASRPYSTIILKESESKIAFDLNHNKIFHYSHMGEDIGASEAKRCIKDLKSLIKAVSDHSEVDSPLFQYLTIEPNKLSDNDFIGIIKDLSDKEKHVFALVQLAKTEMNKSNFDEAAKLWKKAHEKVESESYFTQQYALATYKSMQPSERTALNDSLQIIALLQPDNTNDPETLGITGAIYKNLWLLDKDREHLNRAIKYYGKGFNINSDYYTGENYALCLDYKAAVEENLNEKTYHKIEARKTRERIIEELNSIFEVDEYQNRVDIMWIYASYSNCILALGNEIEATKYEELFFELCNVEWQRSTFVKSKKYIENLIK